MFATPTTKFAKLGGALEDGRHRIIFDDKVYTISSKRDAIALANVINGSLAEETDQVKRSKLFTDLSKRFDDQVSKGKSLSVSTMFKQIDKRSLPGGTKIGRAHV